MTLQSSSVDGGPLTVRSLETAKQSQTTVSTVGPFDSSVRFDASDASYSVPALGSNVVRLTIVGAGGGACRSGVTPSATANAGGATTVSGTGFSYTALGGAQGKTGSNAGSNANPGLVSGNGGQQGPFYSGTTNGNQPESYSSQGMGGQIIIKYVDLSGVSTLNVSLGAGGTGPGADGGRGEVILEYRAAS